jgi:hypothetical protein
MALRIQSLQGTPFQSMSWYPKQHYIFNDPLTNEQGSPPRICLKHDKYLFGSTQRGLFISKWANFSKCCVPLPIYEIIPQVQWVRLHLDIEGVYVSQNDETMKSWLLKIISYTKQALVLYFGSSHSSFDQVHVGNDCRKKRSKYKRSFHLIFYNVLFENNHVVMKDFIECYLTPLITDDPTMFTEGKSVIDTGIYTRNRAFRVMYASKDSQTRLLPWSIDTWQEKVFLTLSQRTQYIEQTLVCGAENGLRVPTRAIEDKKNHQKRHRVHNIEKSRFSSVLRKKQKSTLEFTNQDKADTHDLVKLLMNSSRSSHYQSWMSVGWVIAAVYNQSTIGWNLFDTFSQVADNYNFKECKKRYDSYDGTYRVTIATLHYWAKQDVPKKYKEWLQRRNNRLFHQKLLKPML